MEGNIDLCRKNDILQFEKLVKQAEELIRSDLSAEQAVAVLTAKGNVFCFANHHVMSGNTEDEIAFCENLKKNGDTQITHAVCIWNDFTFDVMSRHLRDLLTECNSSNVEAEILLKGEEGFQIKKSR